MLGCAVGVAGFAGLITRFLPVVTSAVPSALVAVVASTVFAARLSLPVRTLADVAGAATFKGGISVLPSFAGLALPAGPIGTTLKLVAPAAVSIALISILETLLAGKVVEDCIAGECSVTIDNKAQNNRLLAGLAAGNVASALFGGFGGCGLIPQTLLNTQSGGRGSLSSAAYAMAMATFVVAAAPLIGAVPLAALAGVMLTVALSTIQLEWTAQTVASAFSRSGPAWRAKLSLIALLVTSLTCYFVDMAAGIVAGVLVTAASNMAGSGNSGNAE